MRPLFNRKALAFGALLLASALTLGVGQAGATVFLNASFETGDFTGWVPQDMADPFLPLQVGGTGLTPGFGLFASSPTDGSFAALHGFDGEGPGTIRIGQDVTVTAAAPVVSFDYRAGWDMLNWGGPNSLDRLLDVNIEVAGGGANLANWNILTAPGGSINLDTGDLTAFVDLSGFAGQTVRFSIDSYIPESFTGPAFMQIDNLQSAAAVPEPGTLILLGSGLVGLTGYARRRLKI